MLYHFYNLIKKIISTFQKKEKRISSENNILADVYECSKVRKLYVSYRENTKALYPNSKIFTLEEIIETVNENRGDFELLTSVISTLEAMDYTSSNTVEEMVKRAEEHTREKISNNEYTEEQLRIINKYKL